jgi:hypothetical protein
MGLPLVAVPQNAIIQYVNGPGIDFHNIKTLTIQQIIIIIIMLLFLISVPRRRRCEE